MMEFFKNIDIAGQDLCVVGVLMYVAMLTLFAAAIGYSKGRMDERKEMEDEASEV